MSTNPTHRTRLARSLAKTAAVPYQRALATVIEAADAGELPERLDDDGMRQALESLVERLGALGTPAETFEDFHKSHQGKPTARQCEQWATARPGSSEAAPAWVAAGWQRSEALEHGKALKDFEQAMRVGDTECRRYAQAGRAEQLHRLGEREQSRHEFQALADELAGTDLDHELLGQVNDSLVDLDDPEISLAWCDRLLAASDAPNEEGLDSVVVHRSIVREELGLEPDDLDKMALTIEERDIDVMKELGTMLNNAFGYPVEPTGEPCTAFDGLVLVWPHTEAPVIAERWPAVLPPFAALIDYHLNRELQARRMSDEGARRVYFIRGDLEEYARYAAHKNADPALPETAMAYTKQLRTLLPEEEVLAWPPARNDPCWCGREKKYNRCCGSPANPLA